MEHNYKLSRFLDAQNQIYLNALAEIRNGRKESHWMWFIFPQLKGLGRSSTADYYGIVDMGEASAYLQHPVLGKHLIQISSALLEIEGKKAQEIFGSPDDLKLRSSMTLFKQVEGTNPIFQKILDKYFDGKADDKTLNILKDHNS
ncbi:DUF1810 domain-containing protein [Flavobacterium sp.]|uniref:DUF1810 domain-containing protein n=1 Tax=Flavobacterium sp. TaxID=239 RepID=UPI004034C48F